MMYQVGIFEDGLRVRLVGSNAKATLKNGAVTHPDGVATPATWQDEMLAKGWTQEMRIVDDGYRVEMSDARGSLVDARTVVALSCLDSLRIAYEQFREGR